jgi:hypothetical protein
MGQDQSKEASKGKKGDLSLEDIIEQWDQLVLDGQSKGKKDPREEAEAMLNSGIFVLKLLRTGAEGAVTIIAVATKVSETVVPCVLIVDLALAHIEKFFENFASNQSEAKNLPKRIRRCGIIVLKDMIPKVTKEDKESFLSVAQEFMELLVKGWQTCKKWKDKNWRKKIW